MVLRAIVDDFLDHGAHPVASEHAWRDAARAIVPATISGLAVIPGPLRDLLVAIPYATMATRVVIPVLLLYRFCLVVRSKASSPVALLSGDMPAKIYRYRWPQVTRNTAKACMPLLLAVLAIGCFDLMPNVLLGRSTLAGFICDVNGDPIESKNLHLTDEEDSVVSMRDERSDARGFFMVDLKPFARRPEFLKAYNPTCGSITLAISEGIPTSADCHGDSQFFLSTVPHALRWRTTCVRRHDP